MPAATKASPQTRPPSRGGRGGGGGSSWGYGPLRARAGGDVAPGDSLVIGQKTLRVVNPGLPEARRAMKRRAQVILAKDAGYLISRMGISVGSTVLEGGHGSAGLAMHLASVIGGSGKLISVENRPEHATVGRENMDTLREILPEFPEWHLLE